MAQRRNTILIRQQQNEPRPWARTTLNIALAIGLGIVAVIAIVLIFFLLRRFREKNKIQSNSTTSLSQQLRESQISGTAPVYDGHTRGMRSLDSFGTSTWRTALGEKPVQPRDDMVNITLDPGLPPQGAVINIVNISRPLPDAPTTALYSTSRETHAVDNSQQASNHLTRRSVSTRGVPQDIPTSNGSGRSISHTRYGSQGVTSASGQYTGPPVSNPFSLNGSAKSDDYVDPTFTASSIVHGYMEDGDKDSKRFNKIRDSDATLVTTRSSTVLSANTINGGMPSATSTFIPAVPPLPPTLPPLEGVGPLLQNLNFNRISTSSRLRHSNARPSLEGDGVTPIKTERPPSKIILPPTLPPKEVGRPSYATHATSNSTSSVVNVYPQDIKRRGPLRHTPRRKERPVSLLVPAIPRRLDVIVTASPGPA